MPPKGTLLVGGPFVFGVAPPPATPELREKDAIIWRDGRWWRVNNAGDDWEPAEGERA